MLIYFIRTIFNFSLALLTLFVFSSIVAILFKKTELIDRISHFRRNKIVAFSVGVIILLIFFYPRAGGYTHHGDPYYWQIKSCSCIGFQISAPGIDTAWRHCLGIPHSCREEVKEKEGVEIKEKAVFKGYIDSVARWAYQQIITAYIGEESYPNFFYFYVGSENKQVDFDHPEVMALVTEEGKFISESVYDQEVTISGIKREGKICYWIGKTRKGDQESEEKCHKMPIVIVEDILDQRNSSLILTK